MAVTRTADIRALLGGGATEDRLAATHFLAGAGFLVVGGVLAVLGLVSLRFPGLFPISYGRLEPAANLALMIGFGVISLVGGVYYVLPRLTGARLQQARPAALAFAAMAGLTALGVILVLLGLGDGSLPVGLPWWLDAPLAAVLFVPALVVVETLRARTETHSFVTIWFVIGGVVWLPLLYLAHLVGELPSASAVTVAFAESFLSAGYVTMFLVTVGTGLVYYTVVKELDVPLASRQLALVGFWSLGFAGVWWGAAQLTFGPGPTWVSGVVAALGLAYPIGALANAANVSLTLEGAWSRLRDEPAALAGLIALYLTVGVSVLTALAGFPSLGAVTAATPFWTGIEMISLTGIGSLMVAGAAFGALPRLVGRELETAEKARRALRLIVTGAVGLLLTMGAAGILAGYSWIAGSNSGEYVNAGEDWGAGLGGSYDTLLLLALVFGLVLLAGLAGQFSVIFGTVTRGHAIPQELLVPAGADDE